MENQIKPPLTFITSVWNITGKSNYTNHMDFVTEAKYVYNNNANFKSQVDRLYTMAFYDGHRSGRDSGLCDGFYEGRSLERKMTESKLYGE